MKRSKRFTLGRIALAFAICAILAPIAQAKPTAVKQQPPPVDISAIELGPGEIPYLSHGTLKIGPGEIPYVDDGTSAETVPPAPTATAGDDYDLAFGLVSTAVLAVLLAAGLGIVAIRHTRKAAKLSPA
jgi:hypothetical protein